MRIKMPRLSTSNAMNFCRELPSCEIDDTYFFDVSDINNYEPFPMLLTSAAIRQFCEERVLFPWDIQLINMPATWVTSNLQDSLKGKHQEKHLVAHHIFLLQN